MRAREFDNSKLVIFDIDDTLVNTNTLVNVVRDGRVVKQLNSHDFTHYQLQPGEEFDFGRFRDAREFFTQARPIPGMIRQLRQDIATGNRVIMLTARSDFNDREVFLDTFRQYGIDMSKVHVYRAGNLNIKAATEEKKKIILQHLLGKTHYDKVIMYDDSVPNLNAFLSLAQDHPWSRFYAWHVDPSGQAAEYHRTGVGVRESTSSDRNATGEQVLKYILKTQGQSEFRDFLRKEILAVPQWELVNVPVSSLHIPDLDYDEGEDYEVKADPYGRVLFVDFDYAGEVSAHNIDRLPIVIDSQGHIFDGNHRAWAAAELMNRSTIPAWRPVARTDENFADGRVKGRSRPGRVKRSGASCKGSVTDLRARAKKYGGERGRMYHWCANMKSGRNKSK